MKKRSVRLLSAAMAACLLVAGVAAVRSRDWARRRIAQDAALGAIVGDAQYRQIVSQWPEGPCNLLLAIRGAAKPMGERAVTYWFDEPITLPNAQGARWRVRGTVALSGADGEWRVARMEYAFAKEDDA